MRRRNEAKRNVNTIDTDRPQGPFWAERGQGGSMMRYLNHLTVSKRSAPGGSGRKMIKNGARNVEGSIVLGFWAEFGAIEK